MRSRACALLKLLHLQANACCSCRGDGVKRARLSLRLLIEDSKVSSGQKVPVLFQKISPKGILVALGLESVSKFQNSVK
eukprot:s3364_g7.t1